MTPAPFLPPGSNPVYPPLCGGEWRGEGDWPDPVRAYRWSDEIADDPLSGLQGYCLRPVRWESAPPESFACLERLPEPGSEIEVKGAGSLLLDFGVESAGWIEFECDGLGGEVELSLSEYDEPGIVNLGANHPVKTMAPVLEGGTWRLKLNPAYYEGVRYGWLHVRTFRQPFTIRDLRCACQAKPVNYRGHFRSDNRLFDRIWNVAAYSVRLNFLKDHIGAILMERSDRFSWTGDAYTSQMASLCAFGNPAFVAHNLRRTAHDTNGIAGYGLYWIFSLADYVAYSGDSAFAREHRPVIESKMEDSRRVMRESSPLAFFGHDDRLGATFEDPEIPANRAHYRMLHLRACSEAAVLADLLGDAAWADALGAEFRSLLDACRAEDRWPLSLSMHAAADAINAGALTGAEAKEACERLLADPVQRISYSPFNQYFLTDALSRAGLADAACDTVDRCWGGMLRLGATCFWESYRPEWNAVFQPNAPVPNGMHGYTSLCHPWGAGVLRWMQENLAGIRPDMGNGRTYTIAPADQGFVRRFDAATPVPGGRIAVRGEWERGSFEIEAPHDARGIFVLPWPVHEVLSCQVDGKDIPQGDYADGGRIPLPPGGCRIHIGRVAPRQPVEVPAAAYDAPWISVSCPEGFPPLSGIEVSGSVLFAAGPEMSDILNLPDHVTSILPSDAKPYGCPRRERGPLAQPDLRCPQICPSLMFALRTQNPAPCRQSFTVDTVFGYEEDTVVDVYCVDWADEKIVQTCEVFDFETLNLISPTRVLRNFQGGALLTFRCSKSFRLRVCHVRGGDATLSALIFRRAVCS